MKKFILILIFFFLSSCYVTNTYQLHRKYYSLGQTELIRTDIYKEFAKHNTDSIPLKDWLYLAESSPEENISRRIFTRINEDKSELHFVFTTHENKDSIFYDFSIYNRIKEKKCCDDRIRTDEP